MHASRVSPQIHEHIFKSNTLYGFYQCWVGFYKNSFFKKLFCIMSILEIHLAILLKDKRKCFSTVFANSLISYFVKFFPVTTSET